MLILRQWVVISLDSKDKLRILFVYCTLICKAESFPPQRKSSICLQVSVRVRSKILSLTLINFIQVLTSHGQDMRRCCELGFIPSCGCWGSEQGAEQFSWSLLNNLLFSDQIYDNTEWVVFTTAPQNLHWLQYPAVVNVTASFWQAKSTWKSIEDLK